MPSADHSACPETAHQRQKRGDRLALTCSRLNTVDWYPVCSEPGCTRVRYNGTVFCSWHIIAATPQRGTLRA